MYVYFTTNAHATAVLQYGITCVQCTARDVCGVDTYSVQERYFNLSRLSTGGGDNDIAKHQRLARCTSSWAVFRDSRAS